MRMVKASEARALREAWDQSGQGVWDLVRSAPDLAHTVEMLEAERDEARAALAEAQAEILALRGLPEGAIGSAWVFDDGGRRAHWSQITSRTVMRVWPDGSWRAGGTTPGSQFVSGDEGSIRAGMRAAQAATDDVLSCGGW